MGRKLRLQIDSLNVDTFDTGGGNFRSGTVRGHDTIETEWCTGYPECVSKRCQTPHNTCYGTCGCTQNCETVAPYC